MSAEEKTLLVTLPKELVKRLGHLRIDWGLSRSQVITKVLEVALAHLPDWAEPEDVRAAEEERDGG